MGNPKVACPFVEVRALDAYVWLANRLPRVKRRTGDKVSWAALQAQFGADMKDHKKFRRDYLKAWGLGVGAGTAGDRRAPPRRRRTPVHRRRDWLRRTRRYC